MMISPRVISVTPLVNALAGNPKFPGQNTDVLPGLHPAQGLKLELAAKSAWFVFDQSVLPRKENCHHFPCLSLGVHSTLEANLGRAGAAAFLEEV